MNTVGTTPRWRCGSCAETKLESEFHKQNRKGRARPVQYACKECQAKHGRSHKKKRAKKEWAQANREKLNEWNRAYYHSVVKHSEGFSLARAEYARWYRRLKKYGVTKDQYESMMVAQDGKCAICEDEQWLDLRVDHCHDSKRVRGLLCSTCNTGLGLFRDDPQALRNAAGYIETRK